MVTYLVITPIYLWVGKSAFFIKKLLCVIGTAADKNPRFYHIGKRKLLSYHEISLSIFNAFYMTVSPDKPLESFFIVLGINSDFHLSFLYINNIYFNKFIEALWQRLLPFSDNLISLCCSLQFLFSRNINFFFLLVVYP